MNKPSLWYRLRMLLPSERRALIDRLAAAVEFGGVELKDAYAAWKREAPFAHIDHPVSRDEDCPLYRAALRRVDADHQRRLRESRGGFDR